MDNTSHAFFKNKHNSMDEYALGVLESQVQSEMSSHFNATSGAFAFHKLRHILQAQISLGDQQIRFII